ncbi:MAG TPA: preprotein translocase subunit YajC [Acidiferrobacterales bacterium]|nr:preprotein translocase subunit YajC [Acidiferrobacterales bacterium]
MNFFVSEAWAQGAAGAASQAAGGIMGFLPLIIIFIIFYFLLIRPQTKRAKEHKTMLEALAKGDEIVTGGGIAGKITQIDESFLTVEIANGVTVKVQRQAIQSVLPRGTLKS